MSQQFDLASKHHLSYLDVPHCANPITSLDEGGSGTIVFEVARFAGGEAPSSADGNVRVAAELWLPKRDSSSSSTRVPAVIYIASRRGYDREIRARREKYLSRGWAYMALDPFGGRDATRFGICQAAVADAYRALALLSSHPRIDPQRIALSGYSCGGMVALLTSFNSVKNALLDTSVQFRAHVAKGPFCNVFPNQAGFTAGDVLIASGEYDYLSTPEQCESLVSEMSLAGVRASYLMLEGLSHDLSGQRPLFQLKDQFNWHNCQLFIEQDGSMTDNWRVPFGQTQCRSYGAYGGGEGSGWQLLDTTEMNFLARAFRS